LYILVICFFCCEEAPDFGIEGGDIVPPDASITTANETTFDNSSILIEWEGNPTARIFDYRLEYVSTSAPDSWIEEDSWIVPPDNWAEQHIGEESDETRATFIEFHNLDEGVYRFYINGRYDLDNIGNERTLLFKVNAISGPALRIYPLSQTANVDDVIDVYLYFEEVPEDSSVTGLHVGIQVNTDEFEFMSDYPDSLNVEDDGIRYGELITDFFGTTINPDPIYSHSEDDPMAVLSIMGVAVDSSGTGIYGTGSIAKFRLKVLTCCGPQNINIYQQDLLNINGDAHSFNEPVSGSVTVESVLQ